MAAQLISEKNQVILNIITITDLLTVLKKIGENKGSFIYDDEPGIDRADLKEFKGHRSGPYAGRFLVTLKEDAWKRTKTYLKEQYNRLITQLYQLTKGTINIDEEKQNILDIYTNIEFYKIFNPFILYVRSDNLRSSKIIDCISLSIKEHKNVEDIAKYLTKIKKYLEEYQPGELSLKLKYLKYKMKYLSLRNNLLTFYMMRFICMLWCFNAALHLYGTLFLIIF